MQTVKLNNCVQMPIIGYGVFMIDPSITERCVLDALSVGYRSLDTAQYYENEAAVGAAVRKSGIPRDQIFITSKLCQSRPSYVQAKENVKGTLRRMGLDYLDQMLIHWPMGNDSEIWRAFEDLQKEAPYSPRFRRAGPHHARPGQNRPPVSEQGRVEWKADCERILD